MRRHVVGADGQEGAGADVQFRYLEPTFSGVDEVSFLPDDKLADRSRWAANLTHDGTAGNGITYDARVLRVSDDAYWKDFTTFDTNLTPRLLPTSAGALYLDAGERDIWRLQSYVDGVAFDVVGSAAQARAARFTPAATAAAMTAIYRDALGSREDAA